MSATQRLVSLAINDGTLLAPFVERHFDMLDVTAGANRGVWGLGFHGHGEMLVKRAPITTTRNRLRPQLAASLARQLVLAAEHGSTPRHHEDVQPLRDRDWLFAMRGAEPLRGGFVRRVQASLESHAFQYKRAATPEEAVFTVFMDVLHRANVRDGRDITTDGLRRALVEACNALRALAGDDDVLSEAIVTLHVAGLLYVASFGAPLHIAQVVGLGHPASDARGRGRVTHPHFRAVVLSDAQIEARPGVSVEGLTGGCLVEVGLDGAFDVFG